MEERDGREQSEPGMRSSVQVFRFNDFARLLTRTFRFGIGHVFLYSSYVMATIVGKMSPRHLRRCSVISHAVSSALVIEIFDFDRDGTHDTMGKFQTSLQELMSAAGKSVTFSASCAAPQRAAALMCFLFQARTSTSMSLKRARNKRIKSTRIQEVCV